MGSEYCNILAADNARQHNGNVINHNSNNYTLWQAKDDNSLTGEALQQAFLRAAAEGQTPRVKHLRWNVGASLESVDVQGRTALHHACLGGFEDTVQLLLDAGCDVNAYSSTYGTSLCLAAIKARKNVVRLLLKARANTAADGGGLGSALHAACASGDVETVRLLTDGSLLNASRTVHWKILTQFVEVRVFASRDCNPIHITIDEGATDISQMLLEAGANVNARYRSWTGAASYDISNVEQRRWDKTTLLQCPFDRLDIMTFLLDHGVLLDAQDGFGNTALIDAARCDSPNALELLLEKGADVNLRTKAGDTALTLAACHGSDSCLTHLVSAGAKLDIANNAGETALLHAVTGGLLGIVSNLVKNGANVEFQGKDCNTALARAVNASNVEMPLLLLTHGASPNTRVHANGISNYSLASYAVLKDDAALLSGLLKHPPTLDAVKDGKSATFAVRLNRLGCLAVLLDAGASTRHRDAGKTAILHAASYGHTECLQLLLKAGAGLEDRRTAEVVEPTASNSQESEHSFGNTALHEAAKSGRCDAVNVLIVAGAQVGALNNQSKTPAILAAMAGHWNTVQKLVAAGSSLSATNEKGETLGHLLMVHARRSIRDETATLRVPSSAALCLQTSSNSSGSLSLKATVSPKQPFVNQMQRGPLLGSYSNDGRHKASPQDNCRKILVKPVGKTAKRRPGTKRDSSNRGLIGMARFFST